MDFVEEFDQKAQELHEEIEKKDRESMQNPLLYHFRSPKNCLNIVKNRELWFADFRYLQKQHDEDELHHAFKIILDCAQTKSKKHRLWEQFSQKLPVIKDRLSVYVLSCCNTVSEKRIWKKYGGMALGFDFPISQPSDSQPLWKAYYLLRVIYDSTEFETMINKFLELADIYVQTHLHLNGDKGVEELAKSLASHLVIYIPLLKKKDFEWEKEYRLVMPGLKTNDRRDPCDLPSNNFRIIKNEHGRSHFAQPLEGTELKEVWLSDRIKCDTSMTYGVPSGH